MATTETTPADSLILKAIESQIKREAEILIEEAKKELARRTPEIIAGVTVAVMKMTSYKILEDRVVFEIRTKQV